MDLPRQKNYFTYIKMGEKRFKSIFYLETKKSGMKNE